MYRVFHGPRASVAKGRHVRNYKTRMHNRFSDRCFVFADWLRGAYNPMFLLLTELGTSLNQVLSSLRIYVRLVGTEVRLLSHESGTQSILKCKAR